MCHRVQLGALSPMQCILPHPKVLHRSTQPAIITARRAPTSNACVSLDIGIATRDQHKVALAGISCLQCVTMHPFSPEVLHRSTQPQPSSLQEEHQPAPRAYRSTSALRRVHQHKVALAGTSCLQCILPHPEVLHRSTQPAIITARRAPCSN